MTIQSEEVAAKQLVDGSQTALHSHAGGGGGGPNVKSGEDTAPKATEKQVNFNTSFGSIPHVELTPHGDVGVWLTEKTTGYFKWNNNSKNVDVTVDWIATDAGNP